MSSLSPAQKWDGTMALIGGFSLHLTLGTLYCFGNLNTYMCSYLRRYVHPGIGYSDMIWIPALATVGQGTFMTFSGYLEERIGVRFTILTGASIMTAGVYFTYFAIQFSVFLTVITYGFMFGLGTALSYAPPMGVAMRWFPRHKGLVNGVIVGGFGLGAFVFNQIQSSYLNPSNKALDPDGYFSDEAILNRVPSVFLLLGSIYGVIQLLAIFLINSPNRTEEASMVPLVVSAMDNDDDDCIFGEDEELLQATDELNQSAQSMSSVNLSLSSNSSANFSEDSDNLRPGQVLRTSEFWILWATFLCNTQAISYINTMYKAYGQSFINDDHFLAFVGAFAAIFNASGRIFWGHLSDNFGHRVCIMVSTMGLAILFSTLYFIQIGGKALFATWIWAIFFAFCANFVLLPTATAQCFGTKYSSKNYGLVMTGQAVSAPITAVLTQLLHPVLGWFGMFIIIACFALICTLINSRFPPYPTPRAILRKLETPTAQL